MVSKLIMLVKWTLSDPPGAAVKTFLAGGAWIAAAALGVLAGCLRLRAELVRVASSGRAEKEEVPGMDSLGAAGVAPLVMGFRGCTGEDFSLSDLELVDAVLMGGTPALDLLLGLAGAASKSISRSRSSA